VKPLQLGVVPAHAHIMVDTGTNTMRSILALRLALGLLIITWCAAADAATAHRFKPHQGHVRLGPRVTVFPGYAPAQPAPAAKSFAVPGWTEEETLKWLHDGSAGSGKF
jgi:hypothetical protein